jgi:ADP-heptose:LPS heptosyltransferase
MRHEYPDAWLLFTNSTRGDLAAWLTQSRQRFGIVRRGKRRPLLSHSYAVPAGFDESTHHQFELWENFLRHFGLEGEVDLAPLPWPGHPGGMSGQIGLIPGSENTPQKRWPVGHWRRLIESLPGERFVLFGTGNDTPITAAIAAGFDAARVENAAGRTDLVTFAGRLKTCRLLVTNDTGGMHLANALGVPLVALFGPTNPIRTGPIFQADAARILQPPDCPPTGGGSLSDLSPATVLAAVRETLVATVARV